MNMKANYTKATPCEMRVRSMGFILPGSPIALVDIDMTTDLRDRLAKSGQEFTYCSNSNSTDLAIASAHQALANAGIPARDIGLVISAPTLLTSYGFEIPAIAIRAALGLDQADCLNVAQGCVGLLAGMRIASQFLRCEPDRGDVLVVTACQASSLLNNFTHGSFFWGDAAGATVLTAEPGQGLHAESYAEKTSNSNWGAMRIRHGDSTPYSACNPESDLKINVHFSDKRAQADYILGEQERCESLIETLLASKNLAEQDIDALFFPSIGKNRVSLLLNAYRSLKTIVKTDFRYAHLGGVDVLLFLDQFLKANPPGKESRFLAMTPAFTAQWGGMLFRYDV